VRRRQFITLLCGAATWPLAARAQQAAMPVIGLLVNGTAADGASANVLAWFRTGLGESGYVEGKNVAIEYRWSQGKSEALPELAADLARHRVTVIAAPGNVLAALAAKRATTTIPIVFSTGADPVQIGLVASLNRPGGNVTGVSFMNWELAAKRLGLLRELMPGAGRFAVLVDPDDPAAETSIMDLEAAASALGVQLEILPARSNRDIEPAFAIFEQKRADALLVSPQALLLNRHTQILTLAARHAVPAIYAAREWATAGGLMSYGSSLADQYTQAGIYTGRVLKGEKDLPILRATKFDFVVNLQTASALRIDIPPTLLARADEVIE
jgi:putative tryptophan/tyrosine transport system substrate-binding protein